MEIRSMGARLILADRRTNKRTDVTKETGAFRDCGKAPEKKLCIKLENRINISGKYASSNIPTENELSKQLTKFWVILLSGNIVKRVKT